nr:MAG TPA: hypothetical protein [Caudoviricetes sp.]
MFDSDNGFGGGGLWIFGLLVLLALLGGGGGLFGGAGERAATVGDVQRATDFQALERQNNEGVAATRQGVYDVTGAIKDGNYNILGELRDIESVVNSGFADGQKCCCEILRAIDGVNYNGALNTAKINETTVAQTQRILDRMAQDREAGLMQRINQLELDRALCGIPRTNPYGYGIYANFPRMGGCCGNGYGYGYNNVA